MDMVLSSTGVGGTIDVLKLRNHWLQRCLILDKKLGIWGWVSSSTHHGAHP